VIVAGWVVLVGWVIWWIRRPPTDEELLRKVWGLKKP
jgi:hypothetical protein